MTAQQLLAIAADLINGLKAYGIMTPAGFVAPTPQQDAQLAAMVEAVLKANGVDVPEKVDAAMQLLPLFLVLIR